MGREEKIRQISDDLLLIPPVIGKSINNILLKNVFAAIKEDITPPHFGIMKILNDAGDMHISKVADWLQVPRSQMTHMVDKLENLGYICRENDTEDRRSIKIRLTEKGKQVFQEWIQTVHEGTRQFIDCLSDAEIEELAGSLASLRDIIIKIVTNHYQFEKGKDY
ncbi:MAG: MarR family transcriptional regulator [Dehalococcoidales bacterium]|nr:MarR family transcriptional regulator [Dehalococcoidales bacterium]